MIFLVELMSIFLNSTVHVSTFQESLLTGDFRDIRPPDQERTKQLDFSLSKIPRTTQSRLHLKYQLDKLLQIYFFTLRLKVRLLAKQGQVCASQKSWSQDIFPDSRFPFIQHFFSIFLFLEILLLFSCRPSVLEH